MKRIKNEIMSKACALALISMTTIPALCNDVFTKASGALDNTKSKLVDFAKAAFPVALIICFISLIFTRDSKKIRVEVGILIAIILGYAGILLVGNGVFDDTVTTIFN